MKNKRGVSPVVATVLIIMVTVAAAAAIYSVVVPFVRDGLEKSTECIDYMELYTFEETGYNCYEDKNTSRLYAFSVKTKFDAELTEGSDSFRIVLARGDASTKQLEVKNGEQEEGFWIRGEEGGVLRVPGAGNVISYVYNTTEIFREAEIYPVLVSGRICGDDKDSVELRECGVGKAI